MSRDQILAMMGNPSVIETYAHVEFWLYPPVNPGTQDFLPVGFVNARVTGWGRTYYDEAIRGAVGADGSVVKRK